MATFEQQPEPIDWSEVPQTIAEYAEFTGAVVHPVLPDDAPARPKYHGKGYGFPENLPEASKKERRALRHVSAQNGEKTRYWIANEILEKHGAGILDEIMAATHDESMTPEGVFRCSTPEVWVKNSSEGSTLVRHEITTVPPKVIEEEPNLAWWRSKLFLRAAAASATMGLAGVMVIAVLPQHLAEAPSEQVQSDDGDSNH